MVGWNQSFRRGSNLAGIARYELRKESILRVIHANLLVTGLHGNRLDANAKKRCLNLLESRF